MTPHRRTFLAASAGGLAWTATRRVPAADGLPEFSFVVVSDIHLGRNDSDAAERQWRQAAAEVAAGPGDFVLHLGDVVDGGREAQYPVYVAARRALRKPVYEVPGNHDPVALFEKYVRTPADATFDHAGVRFLLFNNARPDSHLGAVTPAQAGWLEDRCRDAARRGLRLVACCHVPVHTNAHPDRGWHVPPADGQAAFYAVVDRHRDRFVACLHGHFHNGLRGWRDRGRPVEAVCPSACYNQDRGLPAAVAEGRAAGFAVDELRPGYVVATLGRGRLTLRYKPLGHDPRGEYAADVP